MEKTDDVVSLQYIFLPSRFDKTEWVDNVPDGKSYETTQEDDPKDEWPDDE